MAFESLVKQAHTNRVTLRLPVNILEILKEDAEGKDITLNARISSILTRNIAFEKSISALPNITMPLTLLDKLLEKIDDSAIHELVKEGPNQVRKSFLIKGIKYELKEVIDNYFVLMGKYCGWYHLTHEIKDGRCRLVFETYFGSQWTRFLLEYVGAILYSLGVYLESESISDNVIIFVLKMPEYLAGAKELK